MITAEDWSQAFAAQALADLDAYDVLAAHEHIPVCQQLHFLQMTCEKLAKAFLCNAGSDPNNLQSSHAYIARNLPIILRQELFLSSPDAKRFLWLVDRCIPLAREIELLSPAVSDAGRRPANCEYPWLDKGAAQIQVPAEYNFPNLSLILNPDHPRNIILKLVRASIIRLL